MVSSVNKNVEIAKLLYAHYKNHFFYYSVKDEVSPFRNRDHFVGGSSKACTGLGNTPLHAGAMAVCQF